MESFNINLDNSINTKSQGQTSQSQSQSQSTKRRRTSASASFIHDSYSSSVDFPSYIPWQTLSSEVNDKLKCGSVRINKSNRVEWSTIDEENEHAPLIAADPGKRPHFYSSSASHKEISEKVAITEAVHAGVSWPTAAFLLVNTAMGAGLLNYPAAYDRVGGIAIASIIQVALMLLLAATMLILIYCSDLNNDNTYHDVLLSMCGRRAQQLSAISIMLTCYGICVTFLIVIGDQYDRVFSSMFGPTFCLNYWYLDRRFTITLTAILTILPMCYMQRLDFLRYASIVGIFTMFYVVFLTVYQYYVLDVIPGPVKTKPDSVAGLISIIPVMCFAYQTHEVVVSVYACMEKRRTFDFVKATITALVILFFLYCLAGTYGYLTFGSRILPDIMQLYDARDPFVAIGIIALIFKMITTYPLLLFSGRGALDGLYAELMRLSTEQFIKGEQRRRIMISTVWFVTTLVLAIFTPNIGVSIELLGSLAACNVFVFPGVCLIQVCNRSDPEYRRPLTKALFILSCLLITVGAFLFGLIIMTVIDDLRNGHPNAESNIC